MRSAEAKHDDIAADFARTALDPLGDSGRSRRTADSEVKVRIPKGQLEFGIYGAESDLFVPMRAGQLHTRICFYTRANSACDKHKRVSYAPVHLAGYRWARGNPNPPISLVTAAIALPSSRLRCGTLRRSANPASPRLATTASRESSRGRRYLTAYRPRGTCGPPALRIPKVMADFPCTQCQVPDVAATASWPISANWRWLELVLDTREFDQLRIPKSRYGEAGE